MVSNTSPWRASVKSAAVRIRVASSMAALSRSMAPMTARSAWWIASLIGVPELVGRRGVKADDLETGAAKSTDPLGSEPQLVVLLAEGRHGQDVAAPELVGLAPADQRLDR